MSEWKELEACKKSGHPVKNHIVEANEMVPFGSGNEREMLDAKAMHQKKGLKKSQQIVDHTGSTELAANLFRATQTEEKLRRENIKGKQPDFALRASSDAEANQTHFEVGKKVRKTITELGGTMPENLPSAESIKKIEKGQWPKQLKGKK